jgi:hypothetical protein
MVSQTYVMQEQVNDEITIFPNPAENYCIIKNYSLSNSDMIQIFDIYGRRTEAKCNKISGESIQIELDALSAGIYYLYIQDRNTCSAHRIIKK